MSRTAVLLLSALHLTLSLSRAQDAREVAAGRVLDEHGRPVAGAQVTFLHRPVPASLDALPEDRVRAREDGRFELKVLPVTGDWLLQLVPEGGSGRSLGDARFATEVGRDPAEVVLQPTSAHKRRR